MSRPNRSKPAAPAPGPATPAPETQAAAAAAPAPDPVKNIPQVAPDPTGAASEPASAAAEAAVAPVDPKSDDHSDRYGPEGYAVVVTGPAKGRWRIGRKFGPEPVSIPASELNEPQMRALDDDPELTMQLVKLED
jgi:hypothetical protein